MTTRKSARKKSNRFEELGATIPEDKESDITDPSSITADSDTKSTNPDMDLKESFLEFKSSTTTQFCHIDYSLRRLTDTMTTLHKSFESLSSRQNFPDENNDYEQDPYTSSTIHQDAIDDSNDPTDNPTNHTESAPAPTASATTTTLPLTGPSANHRFWKVVRDDNLEPHRFQSLLKGLVLQDDSMHGLRHFYNKIRHAMHTSFKKYVDILPPFGHLAKIPNITKHLVPDNPNYQGYTMIRSVYEWFSDSIANILFDQDVIDKKRTPQAHRIIVTHNHIDDGWDLLFILLSKRCPFLGGKSLDVATEITMLRVTPTDTIHTFYQKAQDLQTKLRYSRETVDKTRLLKIYLKAMSASKDHFPLLQLFIADLNMHINEYGANTEHPQHTCTTIYDYLVSIDAPEKFNLSPHSSNSGYNKNMKNYFRHNSQHNKSQLMKPNISALEQMNDLLQTSSFDDTELSDTSSTSSNQYDNLPPEYAPIIAAFRRSSSIICDACGSKGHHASKCFKRGLSFLPRDVQRRISAYNAKYGTSPQTDRSPAPHKSYHSLDTPDHRPPPPPSTNTSTIPINVSDESPPPPTISSLNHVLPQNTVEEILDIELGTDDQPTISKFEDITPPTNEDSASSTIASLSTQLPTHDPFLHPVIDTKGIVNIDNITTLQTTTLDSYPNSFYRPYRNAIFHLDSGANVHATNNPKDFIIFQQIKSNIHLAVGSTAQCEGVGAIITQLTPNTKPVLLAPVYYCPTAKLSTLSPSALKHYNHFHQVTIQVHDSFNFIKTENDISQQLPLTSHNNLDYLTLPILHLSNTAIHTPILASLFQKGLNEQYIHQKFDHRNLDMIIKMQKHKLMNGIPSNINKFHDTYNCPICLLSNSTKMPRTKHRCKDAYKAGEFFCMDFSFWNATSIRGFTSLLSIICMKTRYSFVFPTRNKRPPLATIQWFISTLRRQGYPVLYVQTDEGGELGRSTDFLKILTDLHCIYMGTGKSGSSLNGIVERPNRTIANSVRAKLMNAGLSDRFWCYAAEDANFKMRRMLHSSIGKSPYQAWTNKKPEFSDMKIWGSHVYVVDTNVTRTKLADRTYVGLFMKFSSTTKIVVYYNPSTKKFGRASHAYFDELHIGLHAQNSPTSPGNTLISQFPTVPSADITSSDIRSNLSTLPILHKPAVTYEVYLPSINSSCPITFHDDPTYGLPYVKNIPQSTPIGQQLPQQALKQQWVLGIGMEEPIHASSAHDELTRLRKTHANKKITIILAPRVIDSNNSYEQERTKFDQLRPILASASSSPSIPSLPSPPSCHQSPPMLIYNEANYTLSDPQQFSPSDPTTTGITIPTISVLVHSPSRPPLTQNVQDCFSSSNPLRSFWIQTVFEQYDKNSSYRVFTKPLPKHSISPNNIILKSVLAPTVKPTDIQSLWKLNIRHCVNGKPLKGITTYGDTRASTVSPDTVRFHLAYSTSLGFQHRTYDCTNAFQCTFEDDATKRIYCYPPPFYLKWYQSRYPHDPIDTTDGPFVLQAAQLIQGSPHAANRWQQNLHLQITSLGYIRNNIDHSFYVKHDANGDIEALLSITVDDLLLSYKDESIQNKFFNHLSSAFDITTPSDTTKLKFLSLTLYQSDHGTSIDQTNHIHSKILLPWIQHYKPLRITNTPFPTDSDFELDLSQSPALHGSDLQLYEARYHGPFNHTIGQLLHIQQWTRPDINYAVSRLASFSRNPNKPAFLALEHLIFYIRSHLHEPIFFPITYLSPNQPITYSFSRKQSTTYTLPSTPVFFSDSAFGNILPQRRSMQSHCGLFNGVITSWSTNIQTTIAADSTDAELRSLYCTIKRLISFSHFLTSSGFNAATPSPIHLYGDNKASINIIQQNKISPRSRHLDIPVTFSYDYLTKKYFSLHHINTKLNPADISTKPTSGPALSRHWNFLRGLRFHPPHHTPHASYLTSSDTAITTLHSNKH